MRELLSVVALSAATILPSTAVAQSVIVFVDGNRMEVQSYEVQDNLVLFTTLEGKLRSVPRAYVDLDATARMSQGGGSGEAAPAPPPPPPPPRPQQEARPAPPPPPPAPEPEPMPTESIEPEPPVEPVTTPEPPAESDLAAAPPPVWSNEELQVSLVVPSSSWEIDDLPPSFDVAAALTNEATEARATLALIRRELRSRGDFREVVEEVRSSIAKAQGFQSIEDGLMNLEPYNAHEFRFIKTVGSVPSYNRIVVVYSRDLAYVLSLTCPEERRAENEEDFEALVRGLVVKKPRNQLTF